MTTSSSNNTPAVAWSLLAGVLADGPVPASEALQRLRELGVSEARARRAKAALGVVSRKGSTWTWKLPAVPRCPTCARSFDTGGHALDRRPVEEVPPSPGPAQPSPPLPDPAPPPEPFVHCSVCGKAAVGLPLGWRCMAPGCGGRYR